MSLHPFFWNKSNSAKIMNRGTGAGGANTNASGLAFEEHTSNVKHLLEQGFVRVQLDKTKNGFYLTKSFEDGSELMFVTQGGLKKCMMNFLGKEIDRCPDEAYIWKKDGAYELYIVEKKNQNGPGSVDTKLLAGPTFRKLYERKLGIRVHYAFTVSEFLKKQWLSDAWKDEREIIEEENIPVFFGDDTDYFTLLHAWIHLK
jgi:hypothetical protein